MRMTTIEAAADALDFAQKAGSRFHSEPALTTYTRSGHIKAGELFAVRWGMSGRCVAVFRIDENFEPINFQDAVIR